MEDNTLQHGSQSLQQKIDKLIADDAEQRKRTWSYYQGLKKDNPNLYLDPKIQRQMDQDAIALGDKFADGDF